MIFVLVSCSQIQVVYSAIEESEGDNNTRVYHNFAESRPATGERIFIFDPNYHDWAAYDENGNLINTGKASGGSLYCPDIGRRCTTIVGEFSVIAKGDDHCKSSKYPIKTGGGAPMPYCTYFSPKGYAIHGSNEIPDDRNASHGCIRITPDAARWLSYEFIEIGSKVIVLPYFKTTK
jgi:hypothetical protein